MGRAAADPESEGECASLGWDQPKPRRFQHVGGVRPVATICHGKGADATVLLADHTLHDQATAQRQPALLQGRRSADADRETRLHVARAAAVETPGLNVGRPGGGMPGLAVADGDHIDMTVEDQRALPRLTEQAGHQHGLGALDLHSGKARMGLEPAHVGLEAVDLEAGLLERQGDEVLHGALVARHRRDAHEILRQLDAAVGVQGLERPGLGSLSDHGRNWCWPR